MVSSIDNAEMSLYTATFRRCLENEYLCLSTQQTIERDWGETIERDWPVCVCVSVCACVYVYARRERERMDAAAIWERWKRHFLAATCACVKEMTHIFRDDRVRDDLHMMGDIWIVEVVNFGQYTLKWYIYIFRRYRHMRKLPLETEAVSHRNRVRERRCQMDTAK